MKATEITRSGTTTGVELSSHAKSQLKLYNARPKKISKSTRVRQLVSGTLDWAGEDQSALRPRNCFYLQIDINFSQTSVTFTTEAQRDFQCLYRTVLLNRIH